MVFRLDDDDAIDQDAWNFDMTRTERTGCRDAFDLGDDKPLAVLGGGSERQIVEGQRLLFHRDVAVVVSRGSPDNRYVDRKRLVEEPLLTVDFDQPDQFFRGACVQFSAAIGRVDESTEANLGKKAGLASRNFAKQVRHASERQIVGLDVIVDRHPGQLRHQTKVSTDQALDEARMSQAIEATIGAIPRRRSKHKREIPRLSGLDETPLQRLDDFVGRSHADKAGRGDGVAGTDDGNRLRGIYDLVAHQPSLTGLASRASSQSAML